MDGGCTDDVDGKMLSSSGPLRQCKDLRMVESALTRAVSRDRHFGRAKADSRYEWN